MNRPTTSTSAAPTRLVRRIVLGMALTLGLAVALAPRTPAVHAQEPAPVTTPKPAGKSVTITDGRGAEIKIEAGDSLPKGTPADAAPGAAADAPPADGAGKAAPRKRARVTIDGIGHDREFDSFDEFVNNEPALFAMVVAIVALVFFAPVLAIALILRYRTRKARMLNETMLMLAEKGIVAPSAAFDALAGGRQAAAVAPYYEQAKAIRHRAAWSDLRKGVLVGGVGLALSVYSLLEGREPNSVGLVLLFVGMGFVVLWWLEERHLAPSSRAPQGAATPPAAGTTPASAPPAG